MMARLSLGPSLACKALNKLFSVSTIRVLAFVPARVECSGPAGQIFPKKILPGTDDGPFFDGKERLGSVG